MELSRSDIEQLAKLHRASLPDSLVSRLGDAYTRAFYRYVERSPKEILLVRRNAWKEVVAGCVLSLDPETVNRRLLFETPLLLYLLPRLIPFSSLIFQWIRHSLTSQPESRESAMPELILIYSAEPVRGAGLGAGLIAELESRLREVGTKTYRVRTIFDPKNRAISFYDRLGFVPEAIRTRSGRKFQVFTRSLGAE